MVGFEGGGVGGAEGGAEFVGGVGEVVGEGGEGEEETAGAGERSERASQ